MSQTPDLDSDKTFIRNFSWVLFALVIFTVLMVVLARDIQGKIIAGDTSSREAAALARIQPIGGVYAGDTGRAAMLAAQQAAAASQVQSVAFDGALDGALIYDSVCATCHDSGVAGSPMMTQAAWQPRIAKGTETLIDHAVNGFNGDAGVMPAKGGRADLTEEQVAVTVEYMLDNLQ